QNFFKTCAWHRIEIKVQIVRTIDIVTARVPLIKVDATEIDDPEQRGQILNDGKVDNVAGAVLDGTQLDPRWPRRRRPLHKKELAGRAIRVALHDHGPVLQVW